MHFAGALPPVLRGPKALLVTGQSVGEAYHQINVWLSGRT